MTANLDRMQNQAPANLNKVEVYNPLDKTLMHFTHRLIETLILGELPAVILPSHKNDLIRKFTSKFRALSIHFRNTRRHNNTSTIKVVTWPLLGWWELALWRRKSDQNFVLVHDPEPLIRQRRLSPRAAKVVSRLCSLNLPHLVTMSPEANEVVKQLFPTGRIHLVPLPMCVPKEVDAPIRSSRRILVLGQHKSARDLDAMAAIGPLLMERGWEPTVAGRGWPAISGWNVTNRFLTEDEFHSLLSSSAVLLLPYRYYFQSEVALRALESGVPIVGRQTGFLRSIFGTDFPGAIANWDEPSDWLAAIESAISSRSVQLEAAAKYAERGVVEWAAMLKHSEGNPRGRGRKF
jgi:glycosyltransferase involved in cell wall biosynthesis